MSDGPKSWSDEEFIGYCSLHSRTERALFHRDHVRRMAALAGDEALLERLSAGDAPEWFSVNEYVVAPLVTQARARLGTLRV